MMVVFVDAPIVVVPAALIGKVKTMPKATKKTAAKKAPAKAKKSAAKKKAKK